MQLGGAAGIEIPQCAVSRSRARSLIVSGEGRAVEDAVGLSFDPSAYYELLGDGRLDVKRYGLHGAHGF